MRAVVERVSHARVTVSGEVTGEISAGLLVLLAVAQEDTDKDLDYMADKICGLRVFEDSEGKMTSVLPPSAGPSTPSLNSPSMATSDEASARPSTPPPVPILLAPCTTNSSPQSAPLAFAA